VDDHARARLVTAIGLDRRSVLRLLARVEAGPVWATFLSQAGQHADRADGARECEAFHAMLNERPGVPAGAGGAAERGSEGRRAPALAQVERVYRRLHEYFVRGGGPA
jgi:hypothetical protein